MSTAEGWVSTEALRELRQRSGLKPKDVEAQARKLGRSHYARVTRQELEQWEQGGAAPELAHLETLSEIYGCPVGHFFLETLPERVAALSYRGLAPGKEDRLNPTTRRSLARFLELAEWFVKMIEEQNVAWEVRLRPPGVGLPDIDHLVSEERQKLGFSDAVREQWTSPQHAFEWWRRQIEDLGIFCFQLNLDPGDIRGASIRLHKRYPFLLVNHQDAEAATGRLFTLLHEYGHLLLSAGSQGIACDFRGRDRTEGGEPVANRFAARMLVSPEEFRESLGQQNELHYSDTWSDACLDRIREPLFVSRDVVAILLQEQGLAPANFYQRKRAQWEGQYAKRRGWGRGRSLKKWERKARDLGTSALRTFVMLHDRAALPVLDSAYVLDTKVERIPQFVEGFRQILAQQ